MNGASSDPSATARAVARVDLGAIAMNVAFLRSRLTGDAELCAVVKADGYGHGIEQAARAALAGGATRLAVVTVEEAQLLANLQLGAEILLLGPIHADQVAAAAATTAELTAWTAQQVAAIELAARELGRSVKLHVKLDTGMGRFGAASKGEALAALELADGSDALEPVAVWTHFATADSPGDDYFPRQLAAFGEFVELARAAHPGLLAHAANSAALLREPASHFDFARAGIAIYGLDPFGGDARASGLTPALSLHSYIASIRQLARGESVGYGRRFTATADTQIATIPIGYGDGWRRILTNNCEVLIAGTRHPQRGTISMDSIMVELPANSGIAVGDSVTLIGSDGAATITTEEVAERAQTINYEITCGLSARTERRYFGGE